jgi:Ca2+:H+ antiporter
LDTAPKQNGYHSLTFLENYWDLIGGVLLLGLSFFMEYNSYPKTLVLIVVSLDIIFLSITVSEIAEILAERLEEPYGSFVLTITAVVVEIILLFSILQQSINSPEAIETVRGGIISAVIVDMNVLLGLAVFIGGLTFKEQEHNEDTSSSYTTILYVAALALLVPSILGNSNHSNEVVLKASYIIGFVLVFFYFAILIFQTKTHEDFFKSTAKSRIFRLKRRRGHSEEDEDENYVFDRLPTVVNFLIIFGLIFLIGVSAETFAQIGMYVFKSFGMSAGFAGLIIAIISVSPEIFTAVKAAKNDQIQRVINIAMGASTVSILLTVPSLLLLGYMFNMPLTLNFNPLEIGALVFTIILAWKTTDNGETNYFEGISHLVLFISYAVIASLY